MGFHVRHISSCDAKQLSSSPTRTLLTDLERETFLRNGGHNPWALLQPAAACRRSSGGCARRGVGLGLSAPCFLASAPQRSAVERRRDERLDTTSPHEPTVGALELRRHSRPRRSFVMRGAYWIPTHPKKQSTALLNP